MTFVLGLIAGLFSTFICFSFCVTASRNEQQCQLEDASLQAERLRHDLRVVAAGTQDARLEACERQARALVRTLE